MHATTLNDQTVDLLTTYAYDAVGNLKTTTEANGSGTADDVITSYAYDSLNRLTDESVIRGVSSPTTLFTQHFELYDNGQRKSVLETTPDGQTVLTSWQYDDLDRLTKETRDEGNDAVMNGGDYADSYAFDLAGNRVSKATDKVGTADDQTIVSVYNVRDQITSTGPDANSDGVPDAGTATTYAYDDNGSTISESSPSGTKKYTWDLRNRQVGLDANGDGDTLDTGDATFAYDNDGVRVRRSVVDGETVVYLQDTANPTGYSQVLEEKASNTSAPTRSYVLGSDVIAQADGSSVRSFLYDGGGSTRALLDATGQVATGQVFAYDAFGTRISSGTPSTTLLYRGEYFDTALGQYLLRARYYNPSVGRFSSFDSYSGDAHSPLSLHKYLYAGANPVMNCDPSGHFSLAETLVDTGISSLLGSILAPVFKPAARYINTGIFSALLPVDVMDHLSKINWSDLSAIMIGGNAGYTVSRGPLGIGGGGGVEALWSPHTHNWGVYGFADANISLFGSSSFGSSVKVGAVFNAPNLGSYEGAFRSITVGYRWLPAKVQSVFSKSVIGAHMLSLPPGTTSLVPSSVPGLGAALLQTGKSLLADVATRLDNKAITIFWSPYVVGSFGFSVESQFSEDGSSGISTGLQTYKLAPGFDPGTALL